MRFFGMMPKLMSAPSAIIPSTYQPMLKKRISKWSFACKGEKAKIQRENDNRQLHKHLTQTRWLNALSLVGASETSKKKKQIVQIPSSLKGKQSRNRSLHSKKKL